MYRFSCFQEEQKTRRMNNKEAKKMKLLGNLWKSGVSEAPPSMSETDETNGRKSPVSSACKDPQFLLAISLQTVG
jgi:hypothetical protein